MLLLMCLQIFGEVIIVGKETDVVFCLRCGRRLKKPDAIERKMGKVCYEKSKTSDSKKPLFAKKETNYADSE